MRGIVAPLLALLLAVLLWFQFVNIHSAPFLEQMVLGQFDSRPARKILIVGNSRTYYHDMPAMLREIADSARAGQKYQIEAQTIGGASFADHWNNRRTEALLLRNWDDIVLQGESAGQVDVASAHSYDTYATKLLQKAKSHSSKQYVVVGWAYDPSAYQGDLDGQLRARHLSDIQSVHRELAGRTGANLINVGRVWEEVRNDHSTIALTEDGNHPTAAGSYIYALMTYARLSGNAVTGVSYVPSGLSPDDAAKLRQAVGDFESVDRD